MANVRTWIDKSGTFKVEAEYLGLNNGKVQLHKLNGKVIDVALDKLSVADVQFVESMTGQQLLPSDEVSPPPLPQRNEVPPTLPSRPSESEVLQPPPLPQRDEAPPLPQRTSDDIPPPPPLPQRSTDSAVPPPMPQRPAMADVPPPMPQRPAMADVPPPMPQRPAMANAPPPMPQRPTIANEAPKLPKRPSMGSEIGSNSSRRTSNNAPPQLPTRPKEATLPPKPISNSNTKEKNPYVWNGFNWKLFFTRVGIDEYSAKHYAERFVKEKFDEELILDADHDLLKKMGLREGDIIRVKKATQQDRDNAKVFIYIIIYYYILYCF